MSAEDPVMVRIARAQERSAAGDRAGARDVLTAIWAEIGGEGGDPLRVVSLAHHMADVQDDPAAELEWDLRALHAADGLTQERAQRHHDSLVVRGFYPSLHLNLAADHRRLGDDRAARRHLDRAEAALPELPVGGYGDLIRGGIARLRAEIGPEVDGGHP